MNNVISGSISAAQFEEDLKEQIWIVNAEWRSRHPWSDFPRLDLGSARLECEAQGFDYERLFQIARTAELGIDWHKAAATLEHYGVLHEHAGEVIKEIVDDAEMREFMDDMPFKRRRERAHSIRTITIAGLAIASLLLTGGLAAYYWSWFSYVATGMKVCAGLWLDV